MRPSSHVRQDAKLPSTPVGLGLGGRRQAKRSPKDSARAEPKREENDPRLAHPLKYRHRETRHGDVRPPFSIGQKSEMDGIPISLTPTPKNSPSCLKGRPEMKQQVNPANGDLLLP
ncbi:hypothetical protein AVEN_197182-1 [Araneus ventricosus]|uniref:Uncharacterized protein n=1 Tax=Araneus ventricosus TaxID=182803 RepID=A0A4Y2V796_ARAVE|nr:hypothetical protein AVEN_197182-1 [Araneus ventricosus]